MHAYSKLMINQPSPIHIKSKANSWACVLKMLIPTWLNSHPAKNTMKTVHQGFINAETMGMLKITTPPISVARPLRLKELLAGSSNLFANTS